MPVIPSGITVATYPSYDAARQAGDTLAGKDFPVQQVSIIGENLKSVERVTGALNWGKAALSGMASGIWFGFFLGLMMSVWSTSSAAFGDYLLIGLMMGAAFGIITGVIRYALIRRQQSYTSVTQVVATTYVLVCPPEVSGEAMRILGTSSEV